MLTFVIKSCLLFLLTYSVTVRSQCPKVASTVVEEIDLTSFSMSLDDGGCLDDGSAASEVGSTCESIVTAKNVTQQDVSVTVNGNSSVTLMTVLENNTALPQVYMMLSSNDSQVCIINGKDRILTDTEDVELQLACSSVGIIDVQLCVYLSDQPFAEGSGAYHAITLYMHLNCTALGDMNALPCETTSLPSGLGQFCVTARQIDTLFNSGIGLWHTLVSAAATMDFCVVRSNQVIFLADVNNLFDYPIYRNLSKVEFDITHTSPTSEYPLVFFVNFTSTNSSVTVARINSTTGALKASENYTFDVALPCFLERSVPVNVTLRWSQFQADGQLAKETYDLVFYRSCIPNVSNISKTIIRDENSPVVVIVVPIVVVVTVSVFLIVSTIICMSWYRSHYKKYPINQTVVIDHAAVNPYYTLQKIQAPLKVLEQYGMEYDYKKLQLEKEIGEGNFGIVYRAQAPGLKRGDWEFSEGKKVAVKMLKDDANFEVMLDFQKEVDTVVNFDHENVIRLLGICTKEIDETCMIFEYMELGALSELLRKSNPRNPDFYQLSADEVTIKSSQFITICIQLAKGLDYLAQKRFVHRDIASRNCLVNSQFVYKIADFGLSRDVYGSDYYKVGGGSACLPVRWMPPESLLYGRFTVKSDVWSYGVLMWEVFTFGQQPYYGASNQEVIDNIRGLILLKCPDLCTEEMYNILLKCWEKMPVKRSHISEILQLLENLQQNNINVVKDIENYVNFQPLVMANSNST